MTTKLCLTIDVEDFYEGMAVLGHPVPKPPGLEGRLSALAQRLGRRPGDPKVTLFVVAAHADGLKDTLAEFATAGHEIACHGPDHGRLPSDTVAWLRKGREMLEDVVQVPVTGFRSPRFDLPPHGDLSRYREELAEAGYEYVSDASLLDGPSPIRQAPVMSWKGVRLGGGSYQRLFPFAAVSTAVRSQSGPAVCYYHSYDFDGTVPSFFKAPSVLMAREVVGRRRVGPIFLRLARLFGSETCLSAAV